jgi:hypothetical protein
MMPTGLETSFLPEPVIRRGKNVTVAFAADQVSWTLCPSAPSGPY